MRAFVASMAEGKPITYRSDALQDFALSTFLERFMFKNPKRKSKSMGTVMQPQVSSMRTRAVPVNSKQFVEQDEAQVAPDELFFFKYFRQLQTNDLLHGKKDDGDASLSIDAAIRKEEADGDVIRGLNFDFANAMGRGEEYAFDDEELNNLLAEDESEDEGEDEGESELAAKRAKTEKKKGKAADSGADEEKVDQEAEEVDEGDVEAFDYDNLDLEALDEDGLCPVRVSESVSECMSVSVSERVSE